MKTSALIALALGAGVAGGVTTHLARGDADATDALVTLEARLASLSQQLSDVARDQQDVRHSLSVIERSGSSGPGPVLSQADVLAAVEAVLANHPDLLAGADAEAEEAAPEAPPVRSSEDYFAALLDDTLTDADREALWEQIREAGLTADVVAAFEALAAADPNNPMLQLALGVAYLKQIETVPQGPQSGALAAKADVALDRALELDPDNWDARFVKGLALSFWPAIFGKQAEAISQFEILRERQAGQVRRPEHAQTFLLLGNLYQQTGKDDLAQAMWLEGYELFPDDPGLAAHFNGQ